MTNVGCDYVNNCSGKLHAVIKELQRANNSYPYQIEISVHFYRFIVICFPLKSKTFNSIAKIKKAIIVIWASAFLLAIPLVKVSAVSCGMKLWSSTSGLTYFLRVNYFSAFHQTSYWGKNVWYILFKGGYDLFIDAVFCNTCFSQWILPYKYCYSSG